MTKTNFIKEAKEAKEVSALMASHDLSESVAKAALYLAGPKANIVKLDESTFLNINDEYIELSEDSDETSKAVMLTYTNTSDPTYNVTKSVNLVKESLEVALGAILDLASKSNKVPTGVKSIANLLKAAGVLKALGVVNENSIECFYNNKKYSLTETDNGIELSYSKHNSFYVPAKLSEKTLVHTHSDVIVVLKEANYMSSGSSNLSDLDYGKIASNVIDGLDENSNLAITFGKGLVHGLDEQYAFFKYTHPYLDESFIKGVNLEDPNKTIGLTEEQGLVYLTKLDKGSPGAINESSVEYKPLDEVDELFLVGSKTVSEGQIINSHKALLI